MAFENINEVQERELHLLWTNADPMTAEYMVFMYAENSMLNHWWDKVTVICWGAVQPLIIQDPHIREMIQKLQSEGVQFSACLTCSDKLGLTEKLQELGIETVRWGKRTSELMQNRKHLLSV